MKPRPIDNTMHSIGCTGWNSISFRLSIIVFIIERTKLLSYQDKNRPRHSSYYAI